MRLLHYSREPFIFDPGAEYVQHTLDKPVGLWLSVEGEHDWAWWATEEAGWTDRLTHASEVVLEPDAKILRLASASDIDWLTREYAAPGPYSYIDWQRVAATYQGIIIAPYIWQRRLDQTSRWYYTWDCASGCIWDASAVAAVVPCEVSA